MSRTETMVRMGDLAATRSTTEVLASIGLGSCIGLVLVDDVSNVAGLAHVMLPESGRAAGQPGKFADTAVPLLLDRVLALGARRSRLDAVLVGGAQMFSFGGGALDIGTRNEAAVRSALATARLPVREAATGGSQGRTVRVHTAPGRVTVKVAGSPETELFRSTGRGR